jgi:hypothetical protein
MTLYAAMLARAVISNGQLPLIPAALQLLHWRAAWITELTGSRSDVIGGSQAKKNPPLATSTLNRQVLLIRITNKTTCMTLYVQRRSPAQ